MFINHISNINEQTGFGIFNGWYAKPNKTKCTVKFNTNSYICTVKWFQLLLFAVFNYTCIIYHTYEHLMGMSYSS